MEILKKGSALVLSGAAFLYLWGCKSAAPEKAQNDAAENQATEVQMSSQSPEESGTEVTMETPEIGKQLHQEHERTSDEAPSIELQARRFGAVVTPPESVTGEWVLEKGNTRLVLKEESRIAKSDGIIVWLDSPFSKREGAWVLSQSDEAILLAAAFDEVRAPRNVVTIAIDPGHGGSDDGSQNADWRLIEKDLNLDLSLRLQEELEALGFKTVLTRYDDRKVDLAKRAEIANAAKADLFVSLHFNAAHNKEAQGLETFVLTPPSQVSTANHTVSESDVLGYPGNRFDFESFQLAFGIQKSMIERLKRNDRGLKKERWAVLKGLDCPGVLVECGFVSNDAEAQLLGTAGYRARLANTLANAIALYAGRES